MVSHFCSVLLVAAFWSSSGKPLKGRTLDAVSEDTDVCGSESECTAVSLRQLRIARHQDNKAGHLELKQRFLPPLNFSNPAIVPDVDFPPTCWYFGEANRVPKMTLVTNFANLPEDVVSCTRNNRMKYAELHGLEYCEFIGLFSANVSTSMQKWMSVYALMNIPTEQGLARHFVMWMDADALITNMTSSVVDVAEQYKDKDLILTGNCLLNACYLGLDNLNITNAGVFIARNSEWTANLTRTLFQLAGANEAFSDRLTLQSLWHDNPKEFDRSLQVVHMKVMDSVDLGWNPGEFVLHLAGTTADNGARGRKWFMYTQVCNTLKLFGPEATKIALDATINSLGVSHEPV
jgi:hypothetical protein